jgi:hypothetical protein
MNNKQWAIRGNEAVKKLRLFKLQNGHPFMITEDGLPPRQSYLEYPDGKIVLVELNKEEQTFREIKVLSMVQRKKLLHTFHLV